MLMPGAMDFCSRTPGCQSCVQAWSNGETLIGIGNGGSKSLSQPQATKALHGRIPSAGTAGDGYRVDAEDRHRRVAKLAIAFDGCHPCGSSATIKPVKFPTFGVIY